MKSNTYIHKRHYFYYWAARPIVLVMSIKDHFHRKFMKIKKGEQYMVIANHQTALDPVFLDVSFSKPVYVVASEHVFHKGWISKVFVHTLAPIKKRKSAYDPGCIKDILRIVKEGGSFAVFPDGNRTWNDTSNFCSPSIVKLIRKVHIPLAIYHFEGGFGVDPRFSDTIRKGKYTGGVEKIYSVEELDAMTDEEVGEIVEKCVSSHDADSGRLFKSPKRAEYLEREFFVCPSCGKLKSLRSEGTHITCSACGLDGEYGENLKMTFSKNLGFHSLSSWYQHQNEMLRDMTLPEDTMLEDDNVRGYDQVPGKKRLSLEGSQLSLNKDALTFGNMSIPLSEIKSFSAIAGTQLTVMTKDHDYLFIGVERFSVISYMMLMQKFVPELSKCADPYYNLYTDIKTTE